MKAMSKLRNNLDQLKRDYAALKYAGDLADDVGVDESRSVLMRIGPVLAMAAAITVAATVWVLRPEPQSNTTVVEVIPPNVVPTVQDDSQSLVAQMPQPVSDTISVPTWSDMGSVTETFSISMPSMPSLTEIDSAITQTDQNTTQSIEEGA